MQREKALLPCFEEILQQYAPLLYGTLKKYGASQRTDQEDLLQEGRLALWDAYTRYEHQKGSFSAYASKYVRGRVLRYLSKQYKHDNHQAHRLRGEKDMGEEALEWELPDTTAEREVSSSVEKEWLKELASTLSAREQLIFYRHLLEQETLKDISVTEKVSYETVKTWKKRALKKLRHSRLTRIIDS